MNTTTPIHLPEEKLRQAAQEGMDAFIHVVTQAIYAHIGGTLNADTMPMLNADQITLLGYDIMRNEVLDGGFIQLIYNGYGPFFFDNPFAKAMRLWGAHDFSKLIYKAKTLYDLNKEDLTRPRSDEEFMALFEQYPAFDDLDDTFIEQEEEITETIARYLDDHLTDFVQIDKS